MSFFKSLNFIRSASVSFLGSIGYVAYRDLKRYPRMSNAYSNGNLIFPLKHNLNEVKYFPRPTIENDLKTIFASTFSNTYYVINGEVGNGKSRSIIETIRNLIRENGSRKLGAPIYVCSHQGKSFADCVADSVGYRYDEHISFQSFMDSILKIRPLPSKQDGHKLQRVLGAIEHSSQIYSRENGRPVVIIIDDIETLVRYDPQSLILLQEKAKLWADSNIVKLVFVCHTEDALRLLRKSVSCWSRAATPLYINDLDLDEAKQFLKQCEVGGENSGKSISEYFVDEIISLVGGRVQTLIDVKRRWCRGDSLDKLKRDLKQKELEKLLDLEFTGMDDNVIKVLKSLMASQKVKLSYFAKENLEKAVDQLSLVDLVRMRRSDGMVFVEFESRLTRSVVQEFLSSL